MALQQNYSDLGTPDGNVSFTYTVTEWLTEIGEALVAAGFSSMFDVRSKQAAQTSNAAGTIALYLVSTKNPDHGATLVVSHRDRVNPYMPGRADGVHVHAQARLLTGGRWHSENYKTDAIPVVSIETIAVKDLLKNILNRDTAGFGPDEVAG
jgi:hypothetical protein